MPVTDRRMLDQPTCRLTRFWNRLFVAKLHYTVLSTFVLSDIPLFRYGSLPDKFYLWGHQLNMTMPDIGFMENIRLWVSTLIIICSCWATAVSQPSAFPKHQIGISWGKGSPVKAFRPSYTYEVQLFQVEYARRLSLRPKWIWELLCQPQFNLSQFSGVDSLVQAGYEFGVNVAIRGRWRLIPNLLSVYGSIGAGPHFVSATPPRQADGFIFSDNAALGLQLKVCSACYVDLRTTLRHISNAGLQKPNGGIDNIILQGGLVYRLGPHAK